MKVTNPTTAIMSEKAAQQLATYRQERNFNATEWVAEKATLINTYFNQYGLTHAVIGVSGGLDSAVVLAVLHEAQKQPNSNLHIIPLLLPALKSEGATHQEEATQKGEEVCAAFNQKPALFTGLTALINTITDELSTLTDEPVSEWTTGQAVSYVRTPILYSTASLLTDNNKPAVVIGTINLSEGGYLGYIGKAGDGMVDLQIVSDLYKSEMFAVAELLNVPDCTLNATPTGDMYDGRSDEEVFGASYDFVELFQHWIQDGRNPELLEDEQFKQAVHNLENMHKYNSHKYLNGSPAVHLDILPAQIPGGWNNTPWKAN